MIASYQYLLIVLHCNHWILSDNKWKHHINIYSLYCTAIIESWAITNESIISISTHCTALQSLNLEWCFITDKSIISISTHCTGLQSLNLEWCIDISDASLIVIAMNCTGLQSLRTYGCDGLSIDELYCYELKSVSKLRAVLLSITDVPNIKATRWRWTSSKKLKKRSLIECGGKSW